MLLRLITPPPIKKKRKENANGLKKSSRAWDYFNLLPPNDYSEPTATYKHCHTKLLLHSKTHGSSNVLSHIDKCVNNHLALLRDPNQTTLAFTNGEGGSLGATNTRFNVEACRKDFAMFVILDEKPFRIMECEGFKNICRQL